MKRVQANHEVRDDQLEMPLQESASRRWRAYLPAVLVIAALVRVILLLVVLQTSGIQGVFDPDTASYLAPIQGMMHGSFAAEGIPELSRTPGYPLFLLLTGMAVSHALLAISAQILLACLSVFFVYKIGLVLFQNERTAVLCAGLYSIEPGSITYSILLYPEALFVVLLLLFIYQILRFLLKPHWIPLLIAAMALSASVYVKPVAYYLPFCGAIGIAAFCYRSRLHARLLWGAAFLLTCAALIGPWQVRNYVETGYSGFSSLSDWQLYSYNAVNVLADRDHLSMRAEWDKLDKINRPIEAALSRAQQFSYYHREAVRIFKANPILFAKVQLRGVGAVILDPGGTENLKHLGLYPNDGYLGLMQADHGIFVTLWWAVRNRPLVGAVDLLLGAVLAVYYGLAVFGISRRAAHATLVLTVALIAVYFVAVSGGPAGRCRYRCPVMPIVALFAGAGLARMTSKRPGMQIEKC
jgi:4-amino-4-deoxy-L-arabinose transferase-like glycosyltransferase